MNKRLPQLDNPEFTHAEKSLWLFLTIFFLLAGGGLLWYFNLTFENAHAALLWLSASGRLARYTPEIFLAIQPVGKMISAALLAAGMGLLVFPRRSRPLVARFRQRLVVFFQRIGPETSAFFREHERPGWKINLALIGLMAAAAGLRLLFLSAPMGHDEAYTIMAFSRQSWLGAVSDYHLPNNHIFQTLLLKLSSTMFGTQPWAERLPVFLAGIGLIPAVYWLARQIYGKATALLASGLAAALPMLIEYSTIARGYALYILFSVLLFGLAVYLSRKNNLFAWVLFILIGAAGFFTVPFMLYPFGAACLWLVVNLAQAETFQAYGHAWRLVKYVLAAGLVTGILSMLLYSPVVIFGTGLNSLIGNSFVSRLSWAAFWPTFGERMKSTWGEWNYDLPLIFQYLLAAGVAFATIFHGRISRVRVPLQFILPLWCGLVVVLQRGDPLTRLWSFGMPFWLIWASAGWLALLTWNKNQQRLQFTAVAIVLLLSMVWGILRVQRYFPQWQPGKGQIERVAEQIAIQYSPGDGVAVASPDDAPLWYYLDQYGLHDAGVYHLEQGDFSRLFVVVNTTLSETPEGVLEEHGLSLPDCRFENNGEAIDKIENLELYRCEFEVIS